VDLLNKPRSSVTKTIIPFVVRFCIHTYCVLEPHYFRLCGIKAVVIFSVYVIWLYRKQLGKGLILLVEGGRAHMSCKSSG